MMHALHLVAAAAVATASFAAASPADAQFYKGKTLNIIINYGAGGNTDIQGRSLMRFMEEYIPGKPRVVIKNMPGAGGVVGTNYLGEAAKRNGTVAGVFTVALMPELSGDPALRISHKDFIMIGAIGQQQITHVRKDLASNLSEFLKVTKPFKSAGHAPNSSKDVSIRLTLGLLGIKHDHVTGYKSAGEIRRALLQNDVQYTEDSLTGYYAAVVPTLIKPGISVPLWHVGVPVKGGEMKHADTVDKSIPTFLDAYRMKFGKDAKPKGLEWEAYQKVAALRQFLRVIMLPPGAPKAATDALRQAWKKTAQDKEYLATYRKENNSDLEPLFGEEAQEVIADVLDIKPALRKFLMDFTKTSS